MITKLKLFENPDLLKYLNGDRPEILSYEGINSYSFFYFSESEYNKYKQNILHKKQNDINSIEAKKPIIYNISSDYGPNDVYLSRDQTHPSSIYSLTDFYPDNEDFLKKKYINAGRFWVGNNIITFWDYPKTKADLDKIIKDINKHLIKDIGYQIHDNWDIEIISEKSNDGDYNWGKKIETVSEVIKIKDYVGSVDFSDEERKIHLLNSKDKRKALMDSGYRAKETKWKKHMKPFESKNYK